MNKNEVLCILILAVFIIAGLYLYSKTEVDMMNSSKTMQNLIIENEKLKILQEQNQ